MMKKRYFLWSVFLVIMSVSIFSFLSNGCKSNKVGEKKVVEVLKEKESNIDNEVKAKSKVLEIKVEKNDIVKISKNETYPRSLENPKYRGEIKKDLFKKMCWEEGKYRNEKEKEFADEINEGKHKWKIEFMKYKKEDGKYLLRPFTEYLFNKEATFTQKSAIFQYFGMFESQNAREILKYLVKNIPDEDIRLKNKIFVSLFRNQEYDLYFNCLEKTINEGYYLFQNFYVETETEKNKRMGAVIVKNKDLKKVKNGFIHLINESSDDCNKSYYAFQLYLLGERKVSLKTADEIKERIDNGKTIYPIKSFFKNNDYANSDIKHKIRYIFEREEQQ